ncbi:glycosyl hydrolase [Lunatimonas lonarensis]|uniref:Glycosyl hydrolase n=1 Tax=Lunatimonas lonarensis TaxID=1232681 RepID=R7ZTU6_9BACT|nr:ThuA domain-containing protein [Lunatimonas lonarensis]EON77424.1 glycosyl hydrolase [Lunatimonas lonarensis]
MNQIKTLLLTLSLLVWGALGSYADDTLKGKKVLVYTKNGEGFVHDNIPYAVESVKRLGKAHGFDVEVSDDPVIFTEGYLKDVDFMVFTSTNNEVFDTDEQRLAFRRYMQAGGGLVGIHSVVGTERKWEWFKMMIGGRFVWHPRFQRFRINKLDHAHPSMEGVPNVWEKEDECYLMHELYPGIRVIMAHDLESLNKDQEERVRELAGNFGRYYPAVWHQDFDGGVVWVTALGHHIKDYEDPDFVNHLYQGMKYVAGKIDKRDYSKSYATDRDTPVRFLNN